MLPRDAVINQVRHKHTQEVPYTLDIEDAVAEKLDKHYGNTDWRDRLKPYIVGVQAVDTDPKEPVDDRYARDAYGGIWRQDMRPWHLEHPPLSNPTFEGYNFPDAASFFRPEWKEQARQTCEQHSDCFLIGHLGWGLFERSWNLRGFENALMDAAVEPEFFAEMLDNLTELYLQFVEYTVDLPVDGIMFGDDWGDQRGVILGPERWRQFLKPRWSKIYKAVHESGKYVLTHCCGSIADIMPDITEMGLDVLESVQPEAAGMNPYGLKAQWGDNLTFWGGLGSQSIIPRGTPGEIKSEIRKLRTEMSRGGGYILAPAKPLQPETPTENAAAVVEAFTEQ